MSRVLLINPSRWGRGITPIWIASHSAFLKKNGHVVSLFDCTFYRGWAYDEFRFNTDNRQYKQSQYREACPLVDDNVVEDLATLVQSFQPDIIFWNGISSHIHGEGEYANFEHGLTLLEQITNVIPSTTILVGAGIQLTGLSNKGLDYISSDLVDMYIFGESEQVLMLTADCLVEEKSKESKPERLTQIYGALRHAYETKLTDGGKVEVSVLKPLALDACPQYDYSIFSEKVLIRAYQGELLRVVDYEFSRGCPYTCSYCVETVIQAQYGFTEKNQLGVLRESNKYLRSKTFDVLKQEVKYLVDNLGINMLRCQDTNFLTIDRKLISRFAAWKKQVYPSLSLYIETRPESISVAAVELLRDLNVCGVGMGIELGSEDIRATQLERFVDTDKIIRAFALLRDAGIRRTAYNIIGIPGQTEDAIRQTIVFNSCLEPDDLTVAFYSAYKGTKQAKIGESINEYTQSSCEVDGQLKSSVLEATTSVSRERLEYYKAHFSELVELELKKRKGD